MKHEIAVMPRVFFDVKIFEYDQKVNRRNDRRINRSPEKVCHDENQVSDHHYGSQRRQSEEEMMQPHFFELRARLNAHRYVDVLMNFVNFMDAKANRRDYVFQQDSASDL